MGLFSTKPILTLKQDKVVARYELIMESIYTIDQTVSTSKTFLLWDLFVKQISPEGYRIRLQTLEHSLLNSDESPMEDLFQAIRAMMKMFSEIDLFVSPKGLILSVFNTDDIKERYLRAKNELVSFQGTSMRASDVFNIPESDIESPDILRKRIQAMEFFDVYFGALFGRSHPDSFVLEKRNLMQNLDLDYSLQSTKESDTKNPLFSKYRIKGNSYSVSKSKLLELWGDAPFINKEELSFNGEYNAVYLVKDESGFIEKGVLKIKEGFTPNFKLEITYTLKRIK